MNDVKKFAKEKSIADPEKRETLKKIGALAYAAPATVLLVTADRATAQSAACDCQLSNLGINVLANTFSATHSWVCPNIYNYTLEITGPGVDLTYSAFPPAAPSGSEVMTNLAPYNSSVFQQDSTYTFTFRLRDSTNNVLQTCIDTVVTPTVPL